VPTAVGEKNSGTNYPLPAAEAQTRSTGDAGVGNREWRGLAFSLAVYLLLAFLANRNVWLHGFSHSIQSSGGQDTFEEIWFIAQTPAAILHGVSPFANGWLNAPVGLNLMDNATMPLLGVLGLPITELFGPIATLNVLIGLGFTLSATTFFLMARRFVSWWPAAFVGGLLYGFSPFFVAEGSAHLIFMFGAIPTLIVLVLHHFVRTGYRFWLRDGLALGVCFALQFYISTEMFASMVVLTLIAICFGAVLWVLRRFEIDARSVIKLGVVAVLVGILGVGYGAWVALRGPEHINGPAQTAAALAGISSDPLGLVVPTSNQHFTFGHASLGNSLVAGRRPNWSVVFDAPSESGNYVGIPLLIVLVAGVCVLRRRRVTVFCSFMAAAALLLSMGSYLHFDGHETGIPLPFIVLAHLPLLESGAASRYQAFFWLFAAMLLALILDYVYDAMRSRIRGRAAAICGLIAACVLFPLVPAWPYPAEAAPVPEWFTGAARHLPVGSTVVVYPVANLTDASSMLWQAMSGLTFRMPGGYAVFATSSGAASFIASDSAVQNAMYGCSVAVPYPPTDRQILTDLRRLRTRAVVVVPGTDGAPCAERLFDRLLGPHRKEGGVLVWSTGQASSSARISDTSVSSGSP
jgi:hypothetical protein